GWPSLKGSARGVCRLLDDKAEVDYNTVGDHIILSFKAPFAGILCTLLTLMGNKVIVSSDFGANKTFFKIRMNNARRLGSCGTHWNSPSTNFFYTGGEIGL